MDKETLWGKPFDASTKGIATAKSNGRYFLQLSCKVLSNEESQLITFTLLSKKKKERKFHYLDKRVVTKYDIYYK